MARTPLYKAAENEMTRRISSGAWPLGMRLGNEFELAEEFKVSQGTMRRALMTLEGLGLLDRKPGRGTIVARAAPAKAVAPNAAGQEAACALALLTPDGAPVSFDIRRSKTSARMASDTERREFNAARLSTMERILMRGGDRVALEDVRVPEAVIGELHTDAATGFAELLDDHGLAYAHIVTRARATVSSMAEAVALSCDRHTALIVLEEDAIDSAGISVAQRTLRVLADNLTIGVV